MKRQVVFVHGRAQEHQDPGSLMTEWIDLKKGVDQKGLQMPIDGHDIRFPN
jgi:hypothetical protein